MAIKKTTIKDIAEALGVSPALVSFAVNGRGREHRVSEDMINKITAKAREMNYHPNSAAKSLRCGISNTIGVILSDISNRFFADIARCIENEASRDGITVMIGSTDEDPVKLESLINVFINKGVDGLIIVPCEGSEKIIDKLSRTHIPLVLIDRTYPQYAFNSVTLDNEYALQLAVKELYGHGYRKIKMVSYYTTISNIVDRECGYNHTMHELGLDDYRSISRVDYNNMKDDLTSIIPEIIKSGCDSIVFSTNRLAIETLVELGKLGLRVPEDIAIVAFDGSETFAFDLYYTTVSYVKQPIEKFGLESYSILRKLIKSTDNIERQQIVLEPTIVSLNSSKRL